MIPNWLAIHTTLAEVTRIPCSERSGERITAAELTLLFLCGAGAAFASGFIRLGLHIPGNAIIRAVVPMALGLSLAPRRFSGFVMSAGALATAAALATAGSVSFDSGAFTSLSLTGPIMDFAVMGARTGWRLYSGLVIVGICTNLLALGSRGATKLLGFDYGDVRPFGIWWSQAVFTYALCGAIAGLIGAVCCFRLRSRK